MWGIHKKYKSLSWWDNFMSGHISLGKLTIFGANAMNWTVNYSTKKYGYICFTLPAIVRFKKYDYKQGWSYKNTYIQWYFYLSPNGTPWASTYYRGSNKDEVLRARVRFKNFGHGFSTKKYEKELTEVNNIRYVFTHREFE